MVVVERQGEYIEKPLGGQEVDGSEALRFVNAEDHFQQMTRLIKDPALIDLTCQTDFYQIFPELTQYWNRS
jgi:hypothetical protein